MSRLGSARSNVSQEVTACTLTVPCKHLGMQAQLSGPKLFPCGNPSTLHWTGFWAIESLCFGGGRSGPGLCWHHLAHRMRTSIRGGPNAARQSGRQKSPICRVVVCRSALQQPKTKEALRDPARIGARASVSVDVQASRPTPRPVCIHVGLPQQWWGPLLLHGPEAKSRGCPWQDCGGSLSLENYMRLPVEQYYELDPAMIVPRQGNRFGLMVPRVHVGPSAFPIMHLE